ncbi:RNA polymerase sigma factor [Membranihabitans marinus]|uniref:RNA polymerase sigma factor n=1 Tax=Membranihabitans marinus TaxID=1227546 RepID=UPI001F008DBC|nr:sigma-70 family RNA polymerase sigma factor [Membranihabitans marinus]
MSTNSIEEVFRNYKNKVYGFILSHVCDEELAKDLTQEVFLSLCIHKDKLTDTDNVSRYVFLTTKNKVIDYFRKVARDKNRRIEFIQSWEASKPKVETEMNEEHCLSVLESIIVQLPPQQQTIYRLSKLQGHPLQEIAQQLHLSSNTVKNHLVQANKFVRQRIKPESIFLLLFLSSL